MDNITIGNRIKNIRQKKGLNQEEFGKLVLDAHKSLVSKWEKGQNLPNNERLKRIAELGNITVNELLLSDMESQIIDEIKKHITDFPFSDSEREFLKGIQEELTPLLLNRINEYGEDTPLLYLILYVQDRLENLADINSSAFSMSIFDFSFKDLNFPEIQQDLEYFYTNISSLDYEVLIRELNYKEKDKKSDISKKLSSILESDEEHKINKQAFEDTVNCFSELNIDDEEMDLVTVYMQNIYYYEGKNAYRISSKESYIAFLSSRISALKEKIRESGLSSLDRYAYETAKKVDEQILNKIK